MVKREILFRGKRIDNGEWVVGDLTRYSEEMSYITVDLIENEVYQVYADTVGQFTGKFDDIKNKIFEHDIIKLYDEFTDISRMGKVEYQNCRFIISAGTRDYSLYENCDIYVFGNIFDNPELLISK